MNNDFVIQVENSAPSQARPARSVEWASQILEKMNVNSIVDMGCGRLRNIPVLQHSFDHITMVDTPLQLKRIEKIAPNYVRPNKDTLLSLENFNLIPVEYDAFFLISVLHIIPDPKVRELILNIIKDKLRQSGFLVVDVPTSINYYRVHSTPENQYNDGYLMGKTKFKTFHKTFTAIELDLFISSVTGFSLIKKTWIEKHLVRIYQKN